MNSNEIAAQLEFFRDIGVDSLDVYGPSPSGRGRRDSLIEAGAPGEGRAEREPARSASAIARSLKKRRSHEGNEP